MRYDAVVFVKGKDDKEYSRKVGAAFLHKSGDGIDVVLDFPVGVTRIALFPAKPKDGQREPAKRETAIDLDDEVPW